VLKSISSSKDRWSLKGITNVFYFNKGDKVIFEKTELNGAYIIKLEKLEDDRGFFARSFCKREFEQQGLDTNIVQCNLSFNKKWGTLRGMHYQIEPYREIKLVSCIKGVLYDVIIDLRPNSFTYKHWFGVELHADDYNMIYVPEGFAHGFQTLENNTMAYYQVSEFYAPEYERGVRWNDPTFDITWPYTAPTVISEKDKSYEDFSK
jgi:dTDP-4-dehydrorhamnose 3,5-epimerase